MTKEPIMIDDVNVAECFHFDKGYKNDNTYCMCDGNMSNLCQENPDCYFKQLARKDQEFEQYKRSKQSSYETMQKEWNDAKNEVKQLKVELKAEKNKLFLPTCYEQLYKEIKEMNNDIAKKCFELEKENKELKEKYKWYDHYKKSALRNKELYNDLSIKYDQLKAENIKFTLESRKLVAQYSSKLERLKQALHEIKKIAETLKADICSYCDSKDTDRCDQTDTDELQQIINKCEVIDVK